MLGTKPALLNELNLPRNLPNYAHDHNFICNASKLIIRLSSSASEFSEGKRRSERRRRRGGGGERRWKNLINGW